MHKHGVVHRDLKPENMMVDDEDRIKLIDFGIAMKEDARRLTFVGPVGHAGHAGLHFAGAGEGPARRPAQRHLRAGRHALRDADRASRPSAGPNPLAVMNERVLNDPKPARKLNAEISPQLQEILYRALERDPRHRYATAHEMAWDLEHQDQVGVQGRGGRSAGRRGVNKKVLLYTGMALVPVALFALMLLLAKH